MRTLIFRTNCGVKVHRRPAIRAQAVCTSRYKGGVKNHTPRLPLPDKVVYVGELCEGCWPPASNPEIFLRKRGYQLLPGDRPTPRKKVSIKRPKRKSGGKPKMLDFFHKYRKDT